MGNGFLPQEQPLQGLDDPYYEPWERLARNLAVSIEKQTFRQLVLEMPLLNMDRLRERREMQRAYVLLSFFTQAWIWQRPEPCEVSLCISHTALEGSSNTLQAIPGGM